MKENLKFLAGFLRHPRHTGAVAPSSRELAELMVSDMNLEEAETVVELGPGTGSFTRLVATRLRPGAVYLALELNGDFAVDLRREFRRVEVVNDSAANLREHLLRLERAHADVILCGLPWAVFPPRLQEEIMDAVVASLRPGGRFATFAYVHAAWFPAARRFQRRLEGHFAEVTRTTVVWKNLPPAFVYRCEKAS